MHSHAGAWERAEFLEHGKPELGNELNFFPNLTQSAFICVYLRPKKHVAFIL